MLLLTNSLRPDLETNGRIKRDLSLCDEQSDDVCTSDIQIFCGLNLCFRGSDPIIHQITITSYGIASHTSISHGWWAWVSLVLVVSRRTTQISDKTILKHFTVIWSCFLLRIQDVQDSNFDTRPIILTIS